MPALRRYIYIERGIDRATTVHAMDIKMINLDSTDTGWFDFRESNVRVAWSSIVPASLVLLLCVGRIPLPSPISKALEFAKSPFRRFITLSEAEAYNDEVTPFDEHSKKSIAPVWFTILLSSVALLETVFWMGLASYNLAAESDGQENIGPVVWAALKAFSWIYAAIKPILHPTATAPYDLFLLYIVQLVAGSVDLGGILFDYTVFDVALPGRFAIAAHIVNLVVIVLSLVLVFRRPLEIPSDQIDRSEIGKSVSPEDYMTLWGYVSFSWVRPLIKRGTSNTLNEADVWALSPTNQARPLFEKLSNIKGKTTLWRLLSANSLHLILDFLITQVSVIFGFSGPFFLKRILDSLSLYPSSEEKRAEAYIFAILAFTFRLLKAQADCQVNWFARLASIRIRSELMTLIYDKALKRKDFSGIVNKDEKEKKNSENLSASDKKATERAHDPKAGADVGKIVNLMSGDASKISFVVSLIHLMYAAPFEIVLACIFLYQLMGWSAFVGFFALIFGWPLNSYLARRSLRLQKGLLAARDKRMAVLNELIGSVKFIKFFAWESKWIHKAMDARKVEIDWLTKTCINKISMSTLWNAATIVVSIISFTVFVALGNDLTVGIAFTSIALFDMLRRPINVIPTIIMELIQSRVALERIDTFLNEDEVTDQVSSLKGETTTESVHGKSFGLKKASFRWNSVDMKLISGKDVRPSSDSEAVTNNDNDSQFDNDQRFELRDISLIFPEGELTVVIGPTASGKSALLLALLGEMTLLPGGEILMTKDTTRVDEHGLTHSISYAAQSPWLQHQSIKENILFGSPNDEDRYNQVVECCALKPDFDILEDGDATEIGARGISLSGGQKARVALARAVYNRSRYVLLDDPLSAVDSHTARFLYERLFLGPLMKNRTVVLVTHHVELVLPGTYYLVQMLDGKIDIQGTVSDLKARGLIDKLVYKTYEEKKGEEEVAIETTGNVAINTDKTEHSIKQARKLVEEEHRETGGVKWNIYTAYLRTTSYWVSVIVIAFIFASELMLVADRYWIMIWSEAYDSKTTGVSPYDFLVYGNSGQKTLYNNFDRVYRPQGNQQSPSDPSWNIHSILQPARDHPLFYVGIYGAIQVVYIIIFVLSRSILYVGSVRASKILFKDLLNTVIYATMRWHDVTPTGRMLNRFSKDIETIDTSLSFSLLLVVSCLISFFSSILVVTVAFPVFFVPMTVLGYFYYMIGTGYLNTGRDLRRMESTARSPIFSGFSELLEGIVTVRAFSAERRFLNSLYEKIDLTTTMWYNYWMANRWLLLNFDALGATAVLITTLLALQGLVGGGLAGFVITSAMTFTDNVYWACRFWTQMELDLNSVERVVEYLKLPQEPPAVIESNRPPAHWPSAPKNEPLVTIEDLQVKYAPDLPSVLHGLSFSLKAGERVGLLGRTGSGKSTMAMSILRFIDPTSGRIIIGGIDITTIGVHDLRERITFIPQDAALFSGTLRDNINPFGEYTDAECLDVLQRVQMITETDSLPKVTSSQSSLGEVSPPITETEQEGEETITSSGSHTPTVIETDTKTKITLDTQVSAGGTNFSQGQRQLISMARALLRQSSILILDEATSSIDFDTDAKIQTTIREEFKNSLLLTVAHRLRTIIDYDRLIILDKGKIAEIDTPYNLIQKERGIFREMCLKSGTFSELEEAAKEKAEQGTLRTFDP